MLNHSNIKRVQDNPIVLKWFESPQPQSDQPDEPDRENYPDQEKNKKNNFNESDLEPRSDTSDTSDSSLIKEEIRDEGTIKGVQFSMNGPIHLEGKEGE